MHGATLRDGAETWPDIGFRASFPEPRAIVTPPAEPAPQGEGDSRYSAGKPISPLGILIVSAIHVALFTALIQMNVLPVRKAKPAPLVIELLAEPPAPPPAEVEPEVSIKPVQPVMVAPPPIVRTPAPQPPVLAVAPAPPPPQAVVVAPPAAPSAAPPAPIAVTDLSSTMIASRRPQIPYESRKARESGTVLILLTLALDGRVEQATLQKSSGFPRLDKAALDAVRHWRWSPTVRNGQPVQVRGVVNVDFIAPK